ncbi:MAG TPA: cell division protein [Lactobacillus sp.]|nr:cell division protein [Lactobacillus sp.]
MSGLNKTYLPHKGDIVLLNFDPSVGHEIRKYRPAVVLSTSRYSQLTQLCLVAPITDADHNHLVGDGLLIKINSKKVDGFVNPLQMHTFDYKLRHLQFVGKLSPVTLDRVLKTVYWIINAREE